MLFVGINPETTKSCCVSLESPPKTTNLCLAVEIAQHAGVEQFVMGFDGRRMGGGDARLQQLFELLRVVENIFGSAVDGLGPHRFGLTITATKAKERHAIGHVGLQTAHLADLLHLVNILA